MTLGNDVPVKMTMVDHLLPEGRAEQLHNFIESLSSIRNSAGECLHKAGTSLDVWIAGHPLEARITVALLAPLHNDALSLLRLFDQIETRLRLFLPAPSLAQFLAGLELRNTDIQANSQPPATAGTEPAPVPAAELLSAMHQAISRSTLALSLSTQAFKVRERVNGGLHLGEQEAMEAITSAESANHAAQAQLDTYRQHAARQMETLKDAPE